MFFTTPAAEASVAATLTPGPPPPMTLPVRQEMGDTYPTNYG